MKHRSLKDYLKSRFNSRVQRVTLEGGFTCPNIDGTKSVGGCTFCTEDGSSSGAQNATHTIRRQLEDGIAKQSKRFRCDKFIAYFQSFTNTYADVAYLKSLYDQVVDHPQVVVLAVGTRPDCVSEEVIDLLESYTARGLEIWVDIGVQTSHNQTLEKINRAHSYEDFVDCAERIARRQNPLIRICTHVIIGLPGESPEMIWQTAEKLSQTPIHDLKIHQLCVLKGTAMEIDYLNGELVVYENMEDYIKVLAGFLERLRSDIVIQRLMGEGKVGELVAPAWADTHKHKGNKNKFLNLLAESLVGC
ncbi:MAG: hypothetical protein RLZZ361_751 [Cyanobacteriota bacterium]